MFGKSLLYVFGALSLTELGGAVDLLYHKDYMGNDQTLIRDDNTAAHVLISNQPDVMQRVLVAFPALNSGSFIALEADTAEGRNSAIIAQRGDISTFADADGFNGVEVELTLNGPAHTIESIFGSIRIIRDYVEGNGVIHKGENDFKYKMYGPNNTPIEGGETGLSEITFVRTFFYAEDEVRFTLYGGTSVAFDIRGKNERPENPVDIGLWHIGMQPLTQNAVMRVRTGISHPAPGAMSPAEIFWSPEVLEHDWIDQLAFLSYADGFLTGSWRFLTYFGRDTLMTLFLLFDDLSADMIENVLVAALGRVSMSSDNMSEWPQGWDRERDTTGFVCHEDEVGDFANWNGGRGPTTTERLMKCDYKHADSDFLVLPLFAKFADREPARAYTLLQKLCDNPLNYGLRYAEMLEANAQAVLRQTAKYAFDPRYENLIAIRHEIVGNWRDSTEGLAFTKYALDINTGFAPAALHAITRLAGSGHLPAIFGTDAAQKYEVWKFHPFTHFEVKVDGSTTEISRKLRDYIENGSDCPQCLPLLDVNANSVLNEFLGVGIHHDGVVAPLLNSDYGMILAFRDDVPVKYVRQAAEATRLQWPRGLHTDAGLLTASPAYMWNFNGGNRFNEIAQKLRRGGYHGEVVWGWQSLMMHYGLYKYRGDIITPTTIMADNALQNLWDGIETSIQTQGAAEMWTFAFDTTTHEVSAVDFVSEGTEGNMVQLWSFGLLGHERPEPYRGTSSGALTNLALGAAGALVYALV